MEELRKRIDLLRAYYNLTGRKFASKLDMKPASVNTYINGTRVPAIEYIINILNVFTDISAEWLLRGEGEMIRGNETTKAINDEIKRLNTELIVKEGVIKELRALILEKTSGKQKDSQKSLVG